ncbi:MAG: penicillin acylase family protein [Marinilabiliales bacterium]|nr:penicillin acylase family protein [Marinilabiliales bacterium]
MKILDRLLQTELENLQLWVAVIIPLSLTHTGRPSRSNNGASERHIFNTADWDKSLTVIPTGTSGIPGSPFYLSQTETYVNNGFYSDPFTDRSRGGSEKI